MRGVVDFSKARLHDVSWWRRTNTLIRAMHHDNEIDVLKGAFAFECALLGNGNLTEESFSKVQARAKKSFNDIINLHQPWAAKSIEQVQQEGYQQLIDTYKRVVGDPDDPAFMAKLKASIAEVQASNAEPKKVTEEQMLYKRLQEQMAARRR
jgi:hypothetical protein